ncbi:MAG: hypothetical protein AAGE89_00600 [Pseudomonadota bacterium]
MSQQSSRIATLMKEAVIASEVYYFHKGKPSPRNEFILTSGSFNRLKLEKDLICSIDGVWEYLKVPVRIDNSVDEWQLREIPA